MSKRTETPPSDLEDYRWLNTPEAREAWALWLQNPNAPFPLRGPGVSPGATFSIPGETPGPRTKHRLAILQTQLSFLKTSKEKFPDPEHWFWTRKLLEQSSDYWCAHETALDIPSGIPVVDLCSGAGADAIAIAKKGHAVTAYDIDPVANALLTANASANGTSVEAILRSAESVVASEDFFIHIDPDRRGMGARVTSVEDFLPRWESLEPMIAKSAGISMKVAPATRFESECEPPHVIRFLSRNRSVRQQRWIWRGERWPTDSIVVSVYHRQRWDHEVFDRNEALNEPFEKRSGLFTDRLEAFVGDYDPAIRAAGVASRFAKRLSCQQLHENGYLIASQPIEHPMVRWFRVIDQLSMDRKKLVAFSRTTPAAVWELKSRGVEFPLEPLRKQLVTSPESDRQLTILFTRVGNRNRAIVGEELDVRG